MTTMIDRVAAALRTNKASLSNPEAESLARAAIAAIRELPEDPGPRYTAGQYSRRSHEAMIDDALARS